MLSFKQVQHIAKLARIGLSDKEILQFQKDLASILEYFEILRDVDAFSQAAVNTLTVSRPLNATREDIARAKSVKEGQNLLAMAPETKDGYLKVKSIL